jgi:DNA-binding MarR family transcriptional regulator
MAPEITFTPQVLGETEKALNAILYRELGHVDLTEHQWIVLRLTVIGGGELDRDQLVGRLAGTLKVEMAEARARVDELVAAGLLQASPGAERIAVTEAGARVHGRVRGAVDEITTRLWGDLPEDELETTGRILATILARANAQYGTA